MNFFTKIATVLLALLVLFSTFSFSVEKYYCGDFLVDVSYLGEADSCNELEVDSCGTVVEENKCCKNEVHYIEGQDDIHKVSLEKINFEKTALLVTFQTSYFYLFQYIEKQTISHEYYSPPELFFDIQVLHEVFII